MRNMMTATQNFPVAVFFITIIAFFSSQETTFFTTAFPSGAGSCVAGDRSPLGHDDDALKGSLASGGFQITLDDKPLLELLDDDDDDVVAAAVVKPDEEIVIKIGGIDPDTMFRGFLLRISSSSWSSKEYYIDLTGTLWNPNNNIDFQIRLNEDQTDKNSLKFCDSGVAVATHTAEQGKTNAYDKNLVDDIIWEIPSDVVPAAPPEDGDGPTNIMIDIEVTVVVNFSTYYYTKYIVKVMKEDEDDNNNNEDESAAWTAAPGGRSSIMKRIIGLLLLMFLLAIMM